MTAATLRCVYCDHRGAAAETAHVPSNVRRFMSERFEVWRCAACRSLHAADEVDLDHYYAGYPVHALPYDWRTRPFYDHQRWRLFASGLRRRHRVLDYGCGNGPLVRFLNARGYVAAGYDRYAPAFADPAPLSETWDVVVCQDVIEHVPDPVALLDELGRLARPGGLVAIGTPNADRLRLDRVSAYRHQLHQPYHRHMASAQILRTLAERRGWRLVRRFDTFYANTSVPFLNGRFIELLMKLRDDTPEAAMEPPSAWLIPLLPWALLVGLFGAPFARRCDVTLHFRTPAAGVVSSSAA